MFDWLLWLKDHIPDPISGGGILAAVSLVGVIGLWRLLRARRSRSINIELNRSNIEVNRGGIPDEMLKQMAKEIFRGGDLQDAKGLPEPPPPPPPPAPEPEPPPEAAAAPPPPEPEPEPEAAPMAAAPPPPFDFSETRTGRDSPPLPRLGRRPYIRYMFPDDYLLNRAFEPDRSASVSAESTPSEILGEPDRFTDLTIYESFLYAPEDTSTARKLGDAEPLIVDENYTLEVAIRLNRTGVSVHLVTFPILNPRRATEPLTVIAVAEVTYGPIRIENPVSSLTWEHGSDSTPAYMRLQPLKLHHPSSKAEIEVRLYHSNLDLLDVVRLTVTVATDTQAADTGSSLRWYRDATGTPALDPDAVLRGVNITVAQEPNGYRFTFLFLRGDKKPELPFVRRLSSGDLLALLRSARDFWTRTAVTSVYSNKVTPSSLTWRNHLTELRSIGFKAWMLLFGDPASATLGAAEEVGKLIQSLDIKENTHIQITYHEDITDFVFPWSLLYPLEETDAVNPNKFWGARFEIEQVWNGRIKDNLDTDDVSIAVALDAKFGQTDAEETMFEQMVAAANGRILLTQTLKDKTTLLTAMRNMPAAHMYYFFCHGYAPAGPAVIQADGVQLLQKAINELPTADQAIWQTVLTLTAKMKDEAWIFLGDSEITESQLGIAADYFRSRRPVVFMNMCHSAALAPSMTSGLVRLFLRRSAAAVIGTEAPMTSVFAHAFAERFFMHLLANDSIGTAMLKARRHFLSEEVRNPLGLAYSLYGRATARIGNKALVPLHLVADEQKVAAG